MLQRSARKNRTEVTFVLPADEPAGEVSVVGDFNDWTPGAHSLTPRPDGTRAVTVRLEPQRVHQFRYLAAGDYWFNEDEADGREGPNSRLTT
ncbi:isoamylase early set domain-containing protein [Streptomyces sp. NPDC046876]|uniref:isoamylase early set domain-containing protein n=1 Tax=unclassified Streptomyces TaxID=2593676 RepID=UPI0033DB4D86